MLPLVRPDTEALITLDRLIEEARFDQQRALEIARQEQQIAVRTKMALLKVLPEVIRESAKPMEAIDSIKIVQDDGLTNGGDKSGAALAGGSGGGGSGNFATDAMSAALAYRAQAPVLDGLMKAASMAARMAGWHRACPAPRWWMAPMR